MQRVYQFCNNCGKQGHLFGQCKKPTISIGIIIFRKGESGVDYLMICRKDSIGYIEFLRGKYPLYNKEYIQVLIDQMTLGEKQRLLEGDFDTLWEKLWGDFSSLQYRNEEKHSRDKFIQIKRGIQSYDEGDYSLESLVKGSITTWATPEWGFPKGRRNYQESDLACALREFEEETGYSKSNVDVIKNIVPFEEIFMGSNFKAYKHKYYVGQMAMGVESTTGFQRCEVSSMKWLSHDECLARIRSYHLEKKEVISNVHHVLKNYRLIS